MTFVTACNRFDETRFDAIRRAGQALKSATAVGVTEPKYRELVQACDVEASLASQKATLEAERTIAARYVEMCGAYRDALVVWDVLRSEEKRMGRAETSGYLPALTDDIRRVVKAHSIPIIPALPLEEVGRLNRESLKRYIAGDTTQHGPPPKIHDQIDTASAFNTIWAAGAAKLDRANARGAIAEER